MTAIPGYAELREQMAAAANAAYHEDAGEYGFDHQRDAYTAGYERGWDALQERRWASHDALDAAVARVRALSDTWGPYSEAQLRAALDPEGQRP